MKKGILKRQVEKILFKNPESRNSDITLMTELWKEFYPEKVRKTQSGEFGVYFQDLHKLPTQDNIKRQRALLNAQGKYLPTDLNVRRARKISEEKWRIYCVNNKNNG
jgi:hypothetical protein